MPNPIELWRYGAGIKAWAAVSGLVLWAWVTLHALGLLGVFAGPAAVDTYAAALHGHAGLLWAMRVGLLAVATGHVAATLTLALKARAARGGRPAHAVRYRPASLASRGMRWGGIALLGFVVLHVLHMTTGTIHPAFVPGRVYANLARGLAPPVVACGYAAAAIVLGMHLFHGLWSAPRSLGAGERGATRGFSALAALVALALAASFAAVPIAVLAGALP